MVAQAAAKLGSVGRTVMQGLMTRGEVNRLGSAALAQAGVGFGARGHDPLLDPVDLPDHRRPELADVRVVGGRRRRRHELVRRRDLCACLAAQQKYQDRETPGNGTERHNKNSLKA